MDPASIKAFNNSLIEEFRGNSGKVGGMFAGAPMLLLTTTGHKSGRRHTTPLVYVADGARYIIFASKAGAPDNPVWYDNLTANPAVTIEAGAETFEGRATELKGEERDRFFNQQAKLMPQFAEYAAKTTRVIPVVALTRA